ncbi:hypothetical protein BCR44DRAFT_1431908 [Catenaria anguillulae PL171]|uniref:Uncharacterized protein n=1 Tax=Catenaria anguillulae PL171 TaxID=765915 RepID=A0A1Y2HQI2_9FUNG|nr:hypothetical protein BCR44DRAFT_1431908 [Catenaria anguillulae PL171]
MPWPRYYLAKAAAYSTRSTRAGQANRLSHRQVFTAYGRPQPPRPHRLGIPPAMAWIMAASRGRWFSRWTASTRANMDRLQIGWRLKVRGRLLQAAGQPAVHLRRRHHIKWLPIPSLIRGQFHHPPPPPATPTTKLGLNHSHPNSKRCGRNQCLRLKMPHLGFGQLGHGSTTLPKQYGNRSPQPQHSPGRGAPK